MIDKDFFAPFLILAVWFTIMFTVIIVATPIFQVILTFPSEGILLLLKGLALIMFTLVCCLVIAVPCIKFLEWIGEKLE